MVLQQGVPDAPKLVSVREHLELSPEQAVILQRVVRNLAARGGLCIEFACPRRQCQALQAASEAGAEQVR